MKTIRLLLLAITICFASSVKAQFYSSDRVYTYQYDYTDNDGIKSKSGNNIYVWINFQKDMMGYTSETSLTRVREKMVSSPGYYQDAARNNLARSWNEYNTRPTGQPTMGPARATVSLFKYCSDFSTGSKTTYRLVRAWACNSGNVYDWGGAGNYWSRLEWQTQCYTFSNDKSELIIWHTSNPDKRDYYKRIEESDLKPNTSFLY